MIVETFSQCGHNEETVCACDNEWLLETSGESMWNCEDSTEVNVPRLQINYCVVESMWSCMAETVCACDNEELWTLLLCAQLVWTCDVENSHAFGCTVGQHPLVLLQYHWWNY